MQANKNFFVRGLLATALVAGLGIAPIGCGEETGVKKETKVETPSGTTTHTEVDKVKTTGENPPAAPTDASKPAP